MNAVWDWPKMRHINRSMRIVRGYRGTKGRKRQRGATRYKGRR